MVWLNFFFEEMVWLNYYVVLNIHILFK